MTPRRWICQGLLTLALAFSGLVSLQAEGQSAKPEPVHIGLVGSLFHEVPQPLIGILAAPFNALMKEFTGLEGKLTMGGEIYDVARQLNDKKIDLAVFHGVEFGWVHTKYPELQPLMIAVSNHKHCRAHLVVHKDSVLRSFADLKGKDLSLPRRSKLHCRMFVDRNCADCGQANPTAYFKTIVSSRNMEVALDDLVAGKVDAVVADTVQLAEYDALKPGCFFRLKEIQVSDLFPSAAVVYRKNALDEATLKKFKDGMLKADKTARGINLMAQWQITAFESVPDDYNQVIADILKTYPPPAEVKSARK